MNIPRVLGGQGEVCLSPLPLSIPILAAKLGGGPKGSTTRPPHREATAFMYIANPIRAVRGVFYGWWLALLSSFIHAIVIVPVFQGATIWNVLMKNTFGWSPAQLGLAWSFQRAEGSISTPLSGYLTDKYGPRFVVMVGMFILGGGFVAFSRVNELWHFYLALLLMAAGTGLAGWLPLMTSLNNWFHRRRNMAMSVSLEGLYAGAFVIVPALSWAVDPDRFSPDAWRTVTLGIGVAMLALAWPMTRYIRNRPEDYGQYPDGIPPSELPTKETSGPAPLEQHQGYTWREAIRTFNFWWISIGHAVTTGVYTTVLFHLGIMLDDRGYSLATVGLIVAVSQAVAGAFNLIGGYVSDKVQVRYTLFWFSLFPSAAVAVLLMSENLAMAYLFAVLLGVGMGGRTAPVSSMRGTYFGRREFSKITGLSMISVNVVSVAAPPLAGLSYKWQDESYTAVFAILAVLGILGCFLFLLLGEPRPDPHPAHAST